jgi:hypothetical protein
MCHDARLLAIVNEQAPDMYYNGKKASNLTALKQTVYFNLIWSDGTTSTLINNNGKQIVIHLNIFDEDDG